MMTLCPLLSPFSPFPPPPFSSLFPWMLAMDMILFIQENLLRISENKLDLLFLPFSFFLFPPLFAPPVRMERLDHDQIWSFFTTFSRKKAIDLYYHLELCSFLSFSPLSSLFFPPLHQDFNKTGYKYGGCWLDSYFHFTLFLLQFLHVVTPFSPSPLFLLFPFLAALQSWLHRRNSLSLPLHISHAHTGAELHAFTLRTLFHFPPPPPFSFYLPLFLFWYCSYRT